MTNNLKFLSGGGEMGTLVRTYNWEASPLGLPDKWPQSLRTTLSILLNSKFPMLLYWGPQLICFYNDAFRFSLGNNGKHPSILGMKGQDAWSEIWHILKPQIDQVLTDGEATWSEDQFTPIYHEGAIKDAYWTYSFSPVKNESNDTAGVFLTLIETTEKVNNLNKIKETNDQLTFAIEAMELGTFDFNPLTNKFIGNHYFKEWFGLQDGEKFDISIGINEIAEKDKSRVLEAIKMALEYESGGFYDIEYNIINPITKQERTVRIKGKVWYGEDKKAYRINGTLQDITQQAIAIKQIEESEKRIINILSQSIMSIGILKGADMIITLVNEPLLKIWGKGPDIVGKPLFEVMPELKDQQFPKQLNDVFTTGIPYNFNENRAILTTNGKPEERFFRVVIQPYTEVDNMISGVMVIGTEVTDYVQAKKQIEQNEQDQKKLASHLKLATDSAKVGIWSLDIVSSKLEWSNIHKAMWGYDENCENLIYEDWHKMIVPADKELAFQKVKESKANYSFYEVEYRINKADDHAIRLIRSVGKYYNNDKGEAEKLTGISVDITEQKEVEEALRKSKERLQGGLNVANIVLAEVDYSTGLVTLSPEAALMYGLPVDNLTVPLKQLHDTFHPDCKQAMEKLTEQVIKPASNGLMEAEHQIILPGGEVRWLKINQQFFFDRTVQPAKPLYSILAAQDITAKKEAEEKIKESEAKFRTLSESIPIMVWTAASDGTKNFFNQYFYNYTGLSFEELKSDGMMNIIFPQDLKIDLELWHHSLKTGEDFKMEKRLRHHDGTYRWHLSHAIAQKDTNGKITGWIGSNTDIHEQKTKEQQKDEFISIASHEMKTPLTTAKGYLELLLPILNDHSQTAFLYANKANQSVERLHRLVTELLDASKIQNGKLNYYITTFDFNEMLDESIEDIQLTTKNHSIQKTGSCSKQLTGDRGRLQQVLINLLSNAVKYSPNADKVLVKIEEQESEIKISVQDFGVGMSRQHLDKVFDRYYRAQEHAISFQGLGIGLYISNNIIERHNGKMWAESEVDKGSTFYFTLPV